MPLHDPLILCIMPDGSFHVMAPNLAERTEFETQRMFLARKAASDGAPGSRFVFIERASLMQSPEDREFRAAWRMPADAERPHVDMDRAREIARARHEQADDAIEAKIAAAKSATELAAVCPARAGARKS